MIQDPHPWAANLSELYAHIWMRIVRGVADRRAPARHPTLITVSPDGKPKARTVVLRAAESLVHTLDVHTDLRSAKIADLTDMPFCALHIWDSNAHLQIRLETKATILRGTDVADIWARLPEHTRLSYGITPAPGQPIADALAYKKIADFDDFGVVRLNVEKIDVLHLGPDHRRASFALADNWAGQWLVP